MKKIIVFLCLCVCAGVSAMATEQEELPCNGGTPITANNGTKFCKSNKAMNWWSAFAWCESQGQGRKLAEFKTMCPSTVQYPTNTDGDCPNLQGLAESGWVWSSLAYGSDRALMANLFSGAVRDGTRTDPSHYYFAFCE